MTVRPDWTDPEWWVEDPTVLYRRDRSGRLMTPERLTAEMVRVLRQDAERAGDTALMSMGDSALTNTDAWNCCADLIALRQRRGPRLR